MPVLRSLGLNLALPCFVLAAAPAPPIHIEVDPAARLAPDATPAFEAARRAVRLARIEHPDRAIVVQIAAGTYRLSSLLEFTAADSGSAAAPVTWKAATPGTVTLSAGRLLPAAAFSRPTDPALLARLDPVARDQVWVVDLASHGVPAQPTLPNYFREVSHIARLYANDQLQPLSRWPNGRLSYVTMERVVDMGNFSAGKPPGGTFVYRGDRPTRWVGALADDAGGVWVRGFWRVPWVIEGIRVAAIDPAARTLTLSAGAGGGIGSKYKMQGDFRPGDGTEPWYALNLIEEIDEPGEWALDFPRQRLVWWVPAAPESLQVVLAEARRPVLQTRGASHLIFDGLTFSHALGDGAVLQDGASVTLRGCTIRDVGGSGVVLRRGNHHLVRSSDIYRVGLMGIDVTGGDRTTLTPAGHQVLNNHIHQTGEIGPVPAIRVGEGPGAVVVGVRVANNLVHDVPSAGVRFAGNDNIFEYNELYRLGLDSGDLGAFYTNSGWTTFGNIIRYNFIHHSPNAQGIYLDDGDSGDLAHGNIIYRAQSGSFFGGGHYNTFRHNLVVSVQRGLHVDARGVARGYTPSDPRLRRDYDSVPTQTPPWSQRYPQLVGLLERDTTLPTGVLLDSNVIVDAQQERSLPAPPEQSAGIRLQGNVFLPLGALRDPANFDFRPVRPADFPSRFVVPQLDQVGLQLDPWRPSVPRRDPAALSRGDLPARQFDSQVDLEASNRRP